MNFDLQFFTALCIGITLSAASGFRIFLPALILSIGTINGHLLLTPELAWLGTYPAVLVFAIATIIEIIASYIPLVDSFLKSTAIPIVFLLGTILTAALLPDLAPVVRWTLALVLGGGTASIVDIITTFLRLTSTTLTAGLGNPILSTVEILIALILSLLGLLLPILALILVILLLSLTSRKAYRYWRRRNQ